MFDSLSMAVYRASCHQTSALAALGQYRFWGSGLIGFGWVGGWAFGVSRFRSGVVLGVRCLDGIMDGFDSLGFRFY